MAGGWRRPAGKAWPLETTGHHSGTHVQKERMRGYNQAEVLALSLGKHAVLPVRTDLVKRVRRDKTTEGADTRYEKKEPGPGVYG